MPVPRQQVADPFRRIIQHACQDIGEPGLRIDVVEFGSGNERVEGSCPPAAVVRTGEGLVAASDRNGTQLALGAVVRHAQPALVPARTRFSTLPSSATARPHAFARQSYASVLPEARAP